MEALTSDNLVFPYGNKEYSSILTLENTPLYEGWSPHGKSRADYAFVNGHTLAQYYSLSEPISNESIVEKVEFNTTIKEKFPQ